MGLARTIEGFALQGFAPKLIRSVTGSWDSAADNALAFRVSADIDYQLNGTGTAASLSKGAITVIQKGVTSITFSGTVVIEVM